MAKAKGKEIQPKDFSKYMNALLEEYGAEVASVTVTAADNVARSARKKLMQKTAGDFKDLTGDYRKGWRATLRKTHISVDARVYNATDYRLTHLLEKGHVIKNQFGVTKNEEKKKEADAHPHIANVNDWAIEQFELQLAEQLERLNSR